MSIQEEDLRKFLQGVAENENYLLPKIEITPIAADGANFTAALYLATISEEMKPDLHLFAKVANMTQEYRDENQELMIGYTVECLFYTEMVLKFERIYNKNNVPLEDRMLIPKYYGHISTPGKEMLVLENLQKKGFLSYDRKQPYSWEYASTVVTELAKFHAMGLALRDESPTNFVKHIGQLTPNMITSDNYAQFAGKTAEKVILDDIINEEYKSRLQRYCNVEKYEELRSAMVKKSTTLMFGDYRPSNLMHRHRNGKLEVITLDYQTLTLGCPVVDLIYFIFSGSDEEFRRLHYQKLIDHYFSRLTLSLKQLNIDVEKVYPRKTFDDDFIELQMLGLFLGLAFTPVFLVDLKDVPEVMDSMDSFQIKPNQLAVERMNGIVRDFVKWGLI